MSSDTPSPLRELSVRVYLCTLLWDLEKKLWQNVDPDGPVTEQLKTLVRLHQSVQSIRYLLESSNPHLKKAAKKIARKVDQINAHLIEIYLSESLGDGDRGGVVVDIDTACTQALGKIDQEDWAQLSEPAHVMRSSKLDIRFDSADMCTTWVNTAQAIQQWGLISKDIAGNLRKLACTDDVMKAIRNLDHSSLSNPQEIIKKFIDKFNELTMLSPLIKKSETARKERDEIIKEIENYGRVAGQLFGSITRIETKLKRNNAKIDDDSREHISGILQKIDDAINCEPSHWPPSLLLRAPGFGVDLVRLAERNKVPCDFFGLESGQFRKHEAQSYFNAIHALAQLVATSLHPDGKTNDRINRKNFNEFISDLFRPFGGEVKVYWDCPSDSEFDGLDYKKHFLATECDPFGQGKCLKPTITFISDQESHIFIQDGEYVRPQAIPPIGKKLKEFADALEGIDGHNSDDVIRLRQFHTAMYNFVQFADWWNAEGKKFEVKEQVWTVMSVVTSIALGGSRTDNLQPQAKALYDAFVKEGFHWKTLNADETKENQSAEAPKWAIVPLPMKDGLAPKAPLVACHQPVGLMGPGGKFILPPNKWLVVAPDLLKGDSLLACLYNCKSHINSLHKSVPDWDGLKLFDDAYASFDGGELSKEDRKRIAFDIFKAAYVKKDDAKGKNGEFFKKIARKFYDYLGGKESHIRPQLDVHFSPIKPSEDFGEYDPKPESVWVGNDQPHRSVLSVEQFAFDGQRAIIHLSLGPRFNKQAKAWMDLFDRMADADTQSDLLKPLADFQDDVKALPLSDSADAALAALELKLIGWLSSEDGNRALNVALAYLQNDPASKIGRVWMDCIKLLRNQEEFEIYPRISFVEGNLEVDWPIESAGLRGVDWQFDATAAVGQLVGDRVTFSPDRNDATGVFSLGPESPASPITVAHQLTQLGEALGNERIANVAHALLKLSMVSDVPQLEIESPLRELVQLIADESIWSEVTISQRDQFLAAMRRWAGIHRYKLVPEMFTYAESAVPTGDKEELELIFCDGSEVGRAIVSQFGILDPQGSALQKERCVISAGPPPAGYEQLKAALISEDGLQQLCGLMEQWPAQRVKSERALHNAIKGEFFDALFKAIDSLDDAAKAAQIQEIFAETLKSELSAFLFSPTRIGEVEDGWWKPVNRSETMSGKIKKVIKPGLRDNKGLLIAPAVVELD